MLAFFPPVAFLTIALFVARKMPKLGADNPNGAFVCNHKKCKKLDLIEATVHHTVLEPYSSSPMEDAMQALPITFLPSACVRGGPRLHQKARHVFCCTLFSQQSLTTAFCHSWGWAIHIPATDGRGRAGDTSSASPVPAPRNVRLRPLANSLTKAAALTNQHLFFVFSGCPPHSKRWVPRKTGR